MAIFKKTKAKIRPKDKEKKNGLLAETRKKHRGDARAGRVIFGTAFFLFAVLLVFAFFQNAGSGGELVLKIGRLLLGSAIFILPFICVLGGLLFFGMRSYSSKVALALAAGLTISVAGLLGALEEIRSGVEGMGGAVGFLVAFPLLTIFGFWVTLLILGAGLAAILVLFWQFLEHPEMEEDEDRSLAEKVQEHMRKILEPKFDIESVDPESKQSARTSEKEEKKEPPFFPIPAPKRQGAGSSLIPPLSLLDAGRSTPNAGDIKTYAAIMKKTLENFDIDIEMAEVNVGPSVTQYAFKPAEGVKLSRITGLANDLALSLAAHPLRIEAPIPGKSLVGIEIPNRVRAQVRLRFMMEESKFAQGLQVLPIALGRDVAGTPVIVDLSRMPHLMVAGATGSGKTIALNNIILSMLYKQDPENLRFILVDPKRVEFSMYNDLPHLLAPVIHDTQETINILKWLIKEMERRFHLFSRTKARDIAVYHALYAEEQMKMGEEKESLMEQIPYIVLVIDELADLMASRGKEIEGFIVRLAQMSRAVGIHLVLATQRPSVEVITGLIKANITSRVAFQVASQIDSRTILDVAGAEKLLGEGDMLFLSAEFSKPKRIQGAYVSDKEVRRVITWLAKAAEEKPRDMISEEELSQHAQSFDGWSGIGGDGSDDPLYEEAKRIVMEAKKASASLLQRRLRVGYARAARLLDILEEQGVIGPGEGAKPREVYGAKPGVAPETGESNGEWVSPN